MKICKKAHKTTISHNLVLTRQSGHMYNI